MCVYETCLYDGKRMIKLAGERLVEENGISGKYGRKSQEER
ncbi:hypothetical protein [Bacillus sp. V5-8f]|nr:hypothetical protein [Bacillus sp. V5-8f]